MTPKERLDLLEASHVHLMTEYALFVKQQEDFVAKQNQEWERHHEWRKWFEAERERDQIETERRGAELDRRIADLVSGIGDFIRQSRPAATS